MTRMAASDPPTMKESGMELGSLTTPYELVLGAAIIYVVIGGASLLLAYFIIRAAVRNGVLQALAERERKDRSGT